MENTFEKIFHEKREIDGKMWMIRIIVLRAVIPDTPGWLVIQRVAAPGYGEDVQQVWILYSVRRMGNGSLWFRMATLWEVTQAVTIINYLLRENENMSIKAHVQIFIVTWCIIKSSKFRTANRIRLPKVYPIQ